MTTNRASKNLRMMTRPGRRFRKLEIGAAAIVRSINITAIHKIRSLQATAAFDETEKLDEASPQGAPGSASRTTRLRRTLHRSAERKEAPPAAAGGIRPPGPAGAPRAGGRDAGALPRRKRRRRRRAARRDARRPMAPLRCHSPSLSESSRPCPARCLDEEE